MKAYARTRDRYYSREVYMAGQEMPDFENVVINMPLELLFQVESLIHVPMKDTYQPLTLTYILCSFLAIKQGGNEDLIDYLSRFKHEKSTLLEIMGTQWLDGFTENSQEYTNILITNAAAHSMLKKDVAGRFITNLFLRNADTSCVGEMLVKYHKGFLDKDDRYPKTIINLINVMRKIR